MSMKPLNVYIFGLTSSESMLIKLLMIDNPKCERLGDIHEFRIIYVNLLLINNN